MLKSKLFWLILCFIPMGLWAQLGGNHTYQFLNLPTSGKIASLGGSSVALWGNDLNIADQNPAFLNQSMHNHLSLNYINYIADINFGNVTYARDFGKYGTFMGNVRTIDYGMFYEALATGEITGEFTAAESAYSIGWSIPIDSNFQFGVNVKAINSNLYDYYSGGIATDIGAVYHHPKGLFVAGLVMKNIGTQIKTYYTEAENEPLPFEIELALSKRLKHAPFRFHFGLQHLEQYNISYDDPDDPNEQINALTGELETKNPLESFSQNLFKHLTLGAEFIPTENFYISLAYNAQRRAELKIDETPGMAGLSMGFGIKINRFNISFGRAVYHLAGGSNHFSITTNLSDFTSSNG